MEGFNRRALSAGRTKDLKEFPGDSSENVQFDASHYAFFGKDVTNETELGGLDEATEMTFLGLDDDEFRFSSIGERDEIEGLEALSEIDDLTTTFMKLNRDSGDQRNSEIIGDRRLFSRESSSTTATDWTQEADISTWIDQQVLDADSTHVGKQWWSPPHPYSFQITESKQSLYRTSYPEHTQHHPLQRTSSYPEQPQHHPLQRTSSHPEQPQHYSLSRTSSYPEQLRTFSEPIFSSNSLFSSYPPHEAWDHTSLNQSRLSNMSSLSHGSSGSFSAVSLSPFPPSLQLTGRVPHGLPYGNSEPSLSSSVLPFNNESSLNHWTSQSSLLSDNQSSLLSDMAHQQLLPIGLSPSQLLQQQRHHSVKQSTVHSQAFHHPVFNAHMSPRMISKYGVPGLSDPSRNNPTGRTNK